MICKRVLPFLSFSLIISVSRVLSQPPLPNGYLEGQEPNQAAAAADPPPVTFTDEDYYSAEFQRNTVATEDVGRLPPATVEEQNQLARWAGATIDPLAGPEVFVLRQVENGQPTPPVVAILCNRNERPFLLQRTGDFTYRRIHRFRMLGYYL